MLEEIPLGVGAARVAESAAGAGRVFHDSILPSKQNRLGKYSRINATLAYTACGSPTGSLDRAAQRQW